jgi:hypothetical protein
LKGDEQALEFAYFARLREESKQKRTICFLRKEQNVSVYLFRFRFLTENLLPNGFDIEPFGPIGDVVSIEFISLDAEDAADIAEMFGGFAFTVIEHLFDDDIFGRGESDVTIIQGGE